MSVPASTPLQIDLRRHLREHDEDRDLTRLICEIADASKYIINSIRTGDLGVAGTSNLYGEQQLALDVLADRIDAVGKGGPGCARGTPRRGGVHSRPQWSVINGPEWPHGEDSRSCRSAGGCGHTELRVAHLSCLPLSHDGAGRRARCVARCEAAGLLFQFGCRLED